jgi:hypothetical protein
VNENRVPQFRQKPSARPARPSRPLPTSCPQFPQYRRFSGTCGFASTAVDGSRYGTGGISTSPAPSLPREDRPLDRREPRRDPLRVEPPDVVLGELAEPPEVDGAEGADGADEEGTATGAAARPQTVQ